MMRTERIGRIIDYWIEVTGLDLGGHVILTEAATGNFAAMPSVALRAGAEHVYAWGRDSRYGTAQAAVRETQEVVSGLGLSSERLTCVENERPEIHLHEASLVANTGNVRPLDPKLLKELRSGTVVGLMYDAWEFRDSDISLEVCRERGIRVAGVDESDGRLRIFDSCGPLALKMAFEAGYEVAHNRIFVYSDDAFGSVVAEAFRKTGAAEVTQSKDLALLEQCYSNLDFVFLCSYQEMRSLIGADGVIQVDRWSTECPPGIIHLYGDVDSHWACRRGLEVFPAVDGQPMRMTRTLDDLGPMISIGLYVAGLRAAIAVANGEKEGFHQVIV